MSIDEIDNSYICCTTRDEESVELNLPALLTVERINSLKLPRLRSKIGEHEILDAEDIEADTEKCGLKGFSTRVVKTFEYQSGKRKCKFISRDMLQSVVDDISKKQGYIVRSYDVPPRTIKHRNRKKS